MSPEAPPVGADAETVLVPKPFVPKEVTANELILPPVIATALAFCVDIVPKEPVAIVTELLTKAVVAI